MGLAPTTSTTIMMAIGDALAIALLERKGFSSADFQLFHPGGRKLIETVQEVLGLEHDDFRHSWEVLRQFGNMSSATALFVLNRAMKAGARGLHLLAAFGPGFSAYFAAVDLG